MRRPSFFRPLVKMGRDLAPIMEHSRALTAQVRALNSPHAEDLENALIDLTAALLDAYQQLSKAQQLEKELRQK